MDTPELPFPINLINDGTVVTREGEYLGTWELIHDAIYMFTPDGEDEPQISAPWIGLLCIEIREWLEGR